MKKFLLMSLLLSFISCKPKEYTLDRQDLFKINLGIFEDELDFFERNQTRFVYASGFVVNRGFFYIYNASLGKIMKFSNNGDILSLLYTPRLNIPFNKIIPNGINHHNFNNIEKITIDQFENIYIVDRVIIDEVEERATPYKRIIKLFDDQGNFRYFLGVNGISGSPFGYIEHLSIDNKNQLSVVSRDEERWYIHQFNEKGDLLYNSSPIDDSIFKEITTAYITDISVSSTEPIIFINTINLNNDSNQTNVYIYHLIEDKLIDVISIDPLENLYPYSILGNDRWGRLYFYAFNFTTGSYKILLYELNKNKSLSFSGEFYLLLPKEEFPALFSQIYLSDDGLIASMSIYERFAQFSWWRSDQIYKQDVNEEPHV